MKLRSGEVMSECEVIKVNLPEFPPPQLIVLTIEEAKRISDALEWVDGYMYCNAYKEDIEAFNKRIKQAQSETQYE